MAPSGKVSTKDFSAIVGGKIKGKRSSHNRPRVG